MGTSEHRSPDPRDSSGRWRFAAGTIAAVVVLALVATIATVFAISRRPAAGPVGGETLVRDSAARGLAAPESAAAPPPAPRLSSRDLVRLDDAIATSLAGERPPELRDDEWSLVARLYGRGDSAAVSGPIWLEHGRPGARAREFAASLTAVETEGLRPGDYPIGALTDAMRAATPGPDGTVKPDAMARADVLLTASFVDLANDLLTGRVDPRVVAPGWHIATRASDVPARVASALDAVRSGGDVREVLGGLRPALGGYAELVRALAQYRAIAQHGGWERLPAGPTLQRGDTGSSVAALRHRLAAEGYLTRAVGGDTYDSEVLAAVARFQERHGLTIDSLVGPRTRAALDVPAAHRVRQIEANLERLRWLPRDPGKRFIVVNVPSFSLIAFDDGMRVLTMPVVVGDELASRRTPIFADSMRYIQFGPYWNVPRSIAVNEILPQARRDRGYLARNRYQLLRGWGDDAPVVDPYSLSDADLFSTRYRVRQLPGPTNALGRVKFMFPNDYAVYLHDTPAKSLFDEAHRAHSHGCVRVADPEALAAFVLEDRADWPRSRIAETLRTGRRLRVDLEHAVPVYLVYLTAFAREGEVAFRDDIYDRDARLLAALAAK